MSNKKISKIHFETKKDNKGQLVRKNKKHWFTLRLAWRPKFILESIMEHEKAMHPERSDEQVAQYSSVMFLYFLRILEKCNGSPFVLYGPNL